MFRHTRGSHTKMLTFATAFVGPDKFRFEFDEEGNKARSFIIWTDQSHAYIRWYLSSGRIDEEPLTTAIAAATGVSGGTAYVVPMMLLRQSKSVTALDDAKLDGVETLAGHRCWRIDGRRPQDTEQITVWIDTESFLLRQVVERRHFTESGDPFDTISTSVYDPAINIPVVEELMRAPDTSGATIGPPPPPNWIGVHLEKGSTPVDRVTPDGPAARAGVAVGDKIVSFAGTKVTSMAVLTSEVLDIATGTKADVVVKCGAQTDTLTVTVEARYARPTTMQTAAGYLRRAFPISMSISTSSFAGT